MDKSLLLFPRLCPSTNSNHPNKTIVGSTWDTSSMLNMLRVLNPNSKTNQDYDGAFSPRTQMFPDPEEKVGNYSRPSVQAKVVVGVALRGVHALAISAKGYEGVGPVFKIDTTADPQGGPQAEKGKVRKRRVSFGHRRCDQNCSRV